MGSVAGTTTIPVHEAADGFDNDGFTMTDGAAAAAADIRATSVSTSYTNSDGNAASGAANVFFTSTAGDRGFAINGINAFSFSSMTLEYGYRKESGTTNATFVSQWSTNSGAAWTDFAVTGLPTNGSAVGWYLLSSTVPADAVSSNLSLRWVKSGSQLMRIDDVLLRGINSGPIPTNVQFTASSASVDESSGSYTVTVYKSLSEGNVSGQVVLSGSATEGGGSDYTVDTTNFVMNGATTSANFVVTINNDVDAEPAETIILTLAGIVGGDVQSPSAFTLTIAASDNPTALLISQYTETDSGSTPKGIEIWNVSGGDITFDSSANRLSVEAVLVGTATVTNYVESGTLVDGDVLVIGTSDMSPDVTNTYTFNGDDALILRLGGVLQDVFGNPGIDPGTSWSGNGVNTANQNIQLKDGITDGDIDGWTDPSERYTNIAVGSVLTGFGTPPGGTPITPTNVFFSIASADVAENVGTYAVTIFKSLPEGNVSGEITLGGSALEGALLDFTVDTTNFVMNGATTSATITLTINDDLLEESAESLLLILNNVVGGNIVTPSTFTLTIGDNDQPAEGIAAFRFAATPYVNVSTKDANISASDMTLTSGSIEVNQQTGEYFTNEPYVAESGGWTSDNQAGAKAFKFTITPASGYKVSVTGISVRAYASSAGPSAIGYDINGGGATYAENLTNDVLQVISNGVVGVNNVTNAFDVLIQGWTNATRASSGGGILRIDDVIIFGVVDLIGGGGDTTIDEYDIDKISLSSGTFSITVSASSNGVPYTLIYTTNILKNPPPVGSGTADTENGNGSTLILQDASPTDPTRLYWIKSNN